MGCRTLTCFWLGCFTLTLLILSCMVIPFDHGFSHQWRKGNARSEMCCIVLFLSLHRLAICFENLLLCVPYCLHPHILSCVVTPFLIMGSHLDGKKEMWEAKCIILSFSVFAETGQFHWELAALCSVLPVCPHTQLRGHSLVSAGSFPSCCDLLLVAALLQKLVQVGNNLLHTYSIVLCSTGCVYMYTSGHTVCGHMRVPVHMCVCWELQCLNSVTTDSFGVQHMYNTAFEFT